MRADRRSPTCWIAGVLPLATLAACAVGYEAPADAPRRPEPLPETIAARFDYVERGQTPSFPMTLKGSTTDWDIYDVAGTVTLKGDNEPQKIEIEYYRAKNARERAPALVVTPILGGGNDIARLIAHHFADEGIHVAIVWRGVRVLAAEWPESEVEHQLRRSIAARRRTIDWLETRQEIDSSRIGGYGISMGGIVTTVLAAVEPRLHSAVVAMAAGDIAEVVARSEEPRLVSYRDARENAGHTDLAGFKKKLDDALESDPIRLARYVDTRRVLMFTSERDTIVPTDLQHRLRDALGDPATYELPTGHYGAIFFTSFIKGKSSTWLHERFRAPLARVTALHLPG